MLNVLMAADGPMVIDWTNAAIGDPLVDLALTRARIGISVPSRWAPCVRCSMTAGWALATEARTRGPETPPPDGLHVTARRRTGPGVSGRSDGAAPTPTSVTR
jgi:hypothetical protein